MAISAIEIFIACHVTVFGEMTIEHVHLALGFHRKAVDGVFDVDRRIGIEVAKPPPRKGAEPICQKSQFSASVRALCSFGRKAPNFSAR